MPTPNYGPKKGQWIPESELQGYIKDNGFGPFAWSDDDYLARENAQREQAGLPPMTLEEYKAQAAVVAAATPAFDPNTSGGTIPQSTKTPGSAGAAIAAEQQAGAGEWDEFYRNQMNDERDPTQVDSSFSNESALAQLDLINKIRGIATNASDTRAQRELANAYGDASKQQVALGSTIRGPGGGAGLRTGISGAQSVMSKLPGASRILKLEEEEQARNALAGLLGTARAQDMSQAELLAKIKQANTGLDDARYREALAGLMGRYASNYQYDSDLNNTRLGFDLSDRATDIRDTKDLLNAVGTGAATVASMSGGNSGSTTTTKQPKRGESEGHSDEDGEH